MSKARHKARRLAMQALYAWQMSGQDLTEIDEQIRLDHDMSKVDQEYFSELLHKVPSLLQVLDDHIIPLLDRDLDKVDPTERAILRMGAYEMAFRPDVPYKVAINEGVELAKTFGAEDGHKFINGILDGMAKNLRAVEIKGSASRTKTKKSKSPTKTSANTSTVNTSKNKKRASGK